MVYRADLDYENIPAKLIADENKEIYIEGKKFYYKGKTANRYILEINIKPAYEKKILTVIMFNPSEFGKEKNGIFIDQTITNLIKIANDTGYNFIKVLNLIAIINSKQRNISKDEKIDIDFILSEIDNSDMLVAWGAEGNKRINKNNKARVLIKKLQSKENMFTFCPNKQIYPKHPARLDLNCCRNCYNRKGKFTLEKYVFT